MNFPFILIPALLAIYIASKGKPKTAMALKLSNDKLQTIKDILSVAKSEGITNQYSLAAILDLCYKENNFLPTRENGYSKTSLARIRKIFPQRAANLSDEDIETLKKNDEQFFNAIYSDLGGYRYRGGGYNQLTGKKNYAARGRNIGVDLENNPELIQKPHIAAAALVDYLKNSINGAGQDDQLRYNMKDINSFSTLKDAAEGIYHANAGFGKSYRTILADSTGGRKKMLKNIGFFYKLVQNLENGKEKI